MRRGERFGCYIYIQERKKNTHKTYRMTCVVACAVWLKLDLLRDGAAAIHSNCTTYSLCRKVRNVKYIRNRYRVRAIEKKNISQLWTNYENRRVRIRMCNVDFITHKFMLNIAPLCGHA